MAKESGSCNWRVAASVHRSKLGSVAEELGLEL